MQICVTVSCRQGRLSHDPVDSSIPSYSGATIRSRNRVAQGKPHCTAMQECRVWGGGSRTPDRSGDVFFRKATSRRVNRGINRIDRRLGPQLTRDQFELVRALHQKFSDSFANLDIEHLPIEFFVGSKPKALPAVDVLLELLDFFVASFKAATQST